ncbi:MAG: 50S ribosomal protein L9 [Candidatus Sungbacteria bacterium]|uniref:Large ribosomal subunit protein bL9 n=1 Tax=Candidatus Sungiibacteriota bacterium TaxID=2750080 RepID=A0A9D6LNN4_9BACT|nr:50S ribosomal protein L9 [Candidatus Sungbacteria bacterium]
MDVILLQDVPQVGRKGERRNVSDGYARNFLLARKLAMRVTSAVIAQREAEEKSRQQARISEEKQFQDLAKQLEHLELRLPLKLGKKGEAFGSISAIKISEALAKRGIQIEKEYLRMPNPIKTTGRHRVEITFPHQIPAHLEVFIESELTTL